MCLCLRLISPQSLCKSHTQSLASVLTLQDQWVETSLFSYVSVYVCVCAHAHTCMCVMKQQENVHFMDTFCHLQCIGHNSLKLYLLKVHVSPA